MEGGRFLWAPQDFCWGGGLSRAVDIGESAEIGLFNGVWSPIKFFFLKNEKLYATTLEITSFYKDFKEIMIKRLNKYCLPFKVTCINLIFNIIFFKRSI